MRRIWIVLLIAATIILGTTGAFYFLDRPVLPATGASIEVDRTDLRAENTEPLPAAGRFIISSNCAARLQRGTGYADLCWGVFRQADLDPQKDYYEVTVYGTFGGQHVRWIALEARPLDTTMLAGTDGLPTGHSEGCHPLPLSMIPQNGMIYGEQLCGRIDGGPDEVEGSWRVSWTCDPCLLLGDVDRGIDLEVAVLVAEGTIPNWTILADLGS